MNAGQVQDLLYRDSGLKGLSGDQQRHARASTRARSGRGLAIDYFVYRVGLHAGMLAAALGGLDAFVFTAGIGENSPIIRARIVEKLGWLGAGLDRAANAAGEIADFDAEEPRRALRRADRRGTDDRAAHPGAADGATRPLTASRAAAAPSRRHRRCSTKL